MLLGDAHVEAPPRKPLGEEVEPGAVRHRRRHRDDPLVALRLADQRLREDLGVGWRVRRLLLLRARHHVELRHPVVLVARRLRRGVALALPGQRMDQHRPVAARLHRPQDRHQLLHVVPVDRPDIGEAQLLEQRAADRHALDQVARPPRALLERLRQQPHRALGRGLQILERLAGVEPRQVVRHRADRRRDRHLVVVQDDEQPLLHVPGVVHRLVGHARRHRPVADDADHVAHVRRPEVPRHREAEARRDRGRGMRRPERIVGALRPPGEAREPAAGPQRADPVAPPGQDLVRIALVAHVPDQLVLRRVEDRVDRHRQLHHPQPRPEMPAGHAHRRDRLGAQLVRDLRAARPSTAPSGPTAADAVEERGLRSRIGHGLAPPGPSAAASENELRREPQVPGSRAVGRKTVTRSRHQVTRFRLRALEPEQRHEGRLAALLVLAQPLARRLRVALDVEDVVADLEGEPEGLRIAAERLEVRAARGSRPTPPPRRRAPRSSAPAGR